MSTTQVAVTTKKDWTSDQEVRWCPGCGDYGILLEKTDFLNKIPKSIIFRVELRLILFH